MTIEQCYEALGGNYADVLGRLPSPQLVSRFVGKFPADPSFAELCAKMADGNRPEAFRAAHTLKGVCANLGFTRLMCSVSALTEALRPETDTIPETAVQLLPQVQADYDQTLAAIHAYLG